MSRYLLGLDAGTGSVRALLVDVESGRTTVAARPWSHAPVPGEGGWAYDFDVERNRTLLAEAVREALRQAAAAPTEVAGIAATSMRHNLVLLREGRAVFAVPNRDARPSAEAMEMAAGRGEALYRSTGRWPSPVFLLPRLKWVGAHHPEWLEGSVALSIGDWVAFALCGEAATDFSQAGESMIFDLHRREWMWDWIDELGLPRSLFPPALPSGTLLGKLIPSAGEELGLPPGIPVAVGGADTQCALLGLGALQPGEAALIAGTTAPVQMVVDRPLLDPDRRLWTGLHVLPDRWVVESNAGAMGEPLEWLAGLLYPESPQPVARLMAEAARSRPGAGGLLSTFGAQVFHAGAMGLPVGS
ncbi:MAG: FGGY family carbohydrate kinase, partial [Chloroflexia bacterium]